HKLYADVYAEAGWEVPKDTKEDFLTRQVGEAFTSVSDEFVESVRSSGSFGTSLFFGGGEFDQGFLQVSRAENFATGDEILLGHGVLTKEATVGLEAWLSGQTVAVSHGSTTPTVGSGAAGLP